VTPHIHAALGLLSLHETKRLNWEIARRIDADDFDVVLAVDCQTALKPYLLRFLATPSVFQCHHGLQHRVEYSGDRNPGLGLKERLKSKYYAPAGAWYRNNFYADEASNIQAASLVVTNSYFVRGLLARCYGVEASVIYPGVDVDRFNPSTERASDYVLSAGALAPIKGFQFLAAALGLLPPGIRPALVLAVNSRDPLEEQSVRELATGLRVELRIEEITDDARMVEVYRKARAFVYAPLGEALGMAPLEAMACGTPVVAVGEGGVRETVLDGITGWLVERDPRAFADKLSTLLEDPLARDRMGAAASAYVQDSWSWSKTAELLERALGSVARRQRVACA
jgi:glycosyltransferase involved in cell wall biosynthesis